MNDNSILIERLLSLIERIEPLIPEKAPSIDFAQYAAFRWVSAQKWKHAHLLPIEHFAHVQFTALVGVDEKITALKQNTQQFLHQLPANNVLLTGSRGTGKSSLIKATLTEFANDGLKMVEIDRDALSDLPQLIEILSKASYQFIIFCDDLSFESDDSSYKSLKALLDGSLMNPPNNILFYATSNRRHLLPEYMSDNQGSKMSDNGEIHHSEAIEEKISLSERFGIWMTFYSFSQAEYLNICQSWLKVLDTTIGFTQDTEQEALQFALLRGSRSGRVAMQFAKNYVGAHQLKSLNKE